MIERALYPIVFSKEWGRQMRFITGPRQSGKTTLAQLKLKREGTSQLYYLWDSREVRDRYKKAEMFFVKDSPPKRKKQWVCFDEIHKLPKWKNILKAIFDINEKDYQFIITGSSKLDIFRRAGDSLTGRFFRFHLFPLCLKEVLKPSGCSIKKCPDSADDFIRERLDSKEPSEEPLSALMEFSGFPEPFMEQSKRFYEQWAKDYLDIVVQEDIGSLTRIIDKEYLYDVYRLLPNMIGSPLSVASLASHLELSHPTLKNYLRRLSDFYLAFKIPPYFRNVKRALIKAPKCYLYNWAEVKEPGKRFENYVAVEILTRIHLWMDLSGGEFSLYFIRTRDNRETDFLIVKDETPWLLIEAKLSDGRTENHHERIQHFLGGNVPLVQVCLEKGVCTMDRKNAYRISASRFFA